MTVDVLEKVVDCTRTANIYKYLRLVFSRKDAHQVHLKSDRPNLHYFWLIRSENVKKITFKSLNVWMAPLKS